jgi:hypothetical protein
MEGGKKLLRGVKKPIDPLSAEPRVSRRRGRLRRRELPPGAENRRFGRLSALRVHTKAPYKMDLHRKRLRNAKGT